VIIYEPTIEDREKLQSLKVNQSSLKDDGKKYGDGVDKPWGREFEVKLTRDFSVWCLNIKPGHETSLHCHPNKNTLLTVDEGFIRLETLDGETVFEAGESILIEKGVFHRTKAPQGAVVYEMEWPPNRCDIVRLEDKYGRKKTGYAG
jgi:mannose-6-phosphate isomerase-like protein (cupin superfamily)